MKVPVEVVRAARRYVKTKKEIDRVLDEHPDLHFRKCSKRESIPALDELFDRNWEASIKLYRYFNRAGIRLELTEIPTQMRYIRAGAFEAAKARWGEPLILPKA